MLSLATDSPRPRITLALLAYRQSDVIEDAVLSALGQECEPIEILLSDDASPDTTFEQMRALAQAYTGPHQLVVRRNEMNLGIGAHFNTVVQAARGDLLVMMAGDDISMPNRVALTAKKWDQSGCKVDLIACDLIDMSHDGVDLGIIRVADLSKWTLAEWARQRPYIVGAGHAFTRRLIDRFGPLMPGVGSEDQVMTFRALCSGGAATVDQPLVRYRRGGVSDGMRDFSAAHYVATVQRKSAVLYDQLLADARVAGCFDLVEAATRRERHRDLYIRDLLAAQGFAARLKVTSNAHAISLGWRLRKFFYLQWPGVAAGIRRWQASWKRLRRGDAR